MKLLVFAHVPPPHHGQSYMVQLMLEGFGGDQRRRPAPVAGAAQGIQCYHVNARFSDHLEDIGTFRWGKAGLLLRYCLEAIWCRFRYGVRTFYYVPAPGKRAALYRDWMVMFLCRPFFRNFVHHWHAVGLGDWLKREGTWWERWLTHRLLGRPALGISLATPSMRDALWFRSRDVEVIANGIPDPFPEYEREVAPRREERARQREAAAAEVFRVLYLAHCTREKGLWDTLDGVHLCNRQLAAQGASWRVHLTVAGEFPHEEERAAFMARLQDPVGAKEVSYAGFVSGTAKLNLMLESDALCFPTFYHAEALPVVVVEAMAAGLPLVTTRWRGIPEILPPAYPFFVPREDPAALAQSLVAVAHAPASLSSQLRWRFEEHFITARYTERLRSTMLQLEQDRALPPL